MQSLIKAQPGARDAELFTSMTCPAARAFSLFVDANLIKNRTGKGLGGPGGSGRDRSKYKAFYNFIMAISSISHGTSLEIFNLNNKSLTRKERIKNTKKRYKVDKTALKNFKTEKFLNICKAITVLYRPKKQIKKIFDKKDITYPTINSLQYGFVKFIISNQNEKECLKFLSENEIESSIISLSNLLAQDESVEAIKLVLENAANKQSQEEESQEEESQEEESQEEDKKLNAGFNSIIIKKDKIIINEENETDSDQGDQEGTEQSVDKNKTEDYKVGMALSFTSFYLMRSSIISLLADITLLVPIAINKASDAIFNNMLSENNANNMSESKKIILENKEDTGPLQDKFDKLNSQIEAFNNKFDYDIKTLDSSILKELKGFASNITEEVEEGEAALKQELKSPEEKMIARTEGVIGALENLKSSISDINISKTIAEPINNSIKIIENDFIELSKLDKITEKNKEMLNSLGISGNLKQEIENRLNNIKQNKQEIIEIEKKIASYTDKIGQLKSNVEKQKNKAEENKKEEEEATTVEVPLDKINK